MPDFRDLTRRQREIYQFIIGHVEQHGFQPSLREMMKHFGIGSINGMVCHLQALQTKGLVRLPRGLGVVNARAIRLMGVRFCCVPSGAWFSSSVTGEEAELARVIHSR